MSRSLFQVLESVGISAKVGTLPVEVTVQHPEPHVEAAFELIVRWPHADPTKGILKSRDEWGMLAAWCKRNRVRFVSEF